MFETRAFRYTTYMALAIVISIYGFWIFQSWAGLLPILSDEYCYYVNAQSFTENTTLRAAFTYTGKGSLLFQADGHGFAYSLLHGSIGKLIGFHPLNIPLTNIAFILLALLLVARQQGLQVSQKTAIAVVLLAYFTVPLYSFTFMQESLHLLITVGCTLLLLRIYEKRMARDILFFLLLVGVASLFRNLWLFWSIGLIPLARNRKELLQYLLLFMVCAAVSFMFAKLLWDSFPSYFNSVTRLIRQGLISEAAQSLYEHFLSNIRSYFAGEFSRPYPYYPAKLVIFFSVVAMAVLYYVKKEKIYLAAALIGSVNFALLLVMFDAWDWREIRSMSPLFFMSTVIFIVNKNKVMTLVFLLFVLTSFPYAYNFSSKCLSDRKVQSTAFKNITPLRLFPQQMTTLLDTKPQPLILLGYSPQDYTLDLLLLPLRTPSGKPVRYAINVFREQLNITDYDYILSRPDFPLYGNNLRQVMSSNYFILYEPTGKGIQ